MDAWIEISDSGLTAGYINVASSWMRGLKLIFQMCLCVRLCRILMDAWIEIGAME